MSHTDASFDPGTSKTGVCIWRDGTKIFWTTVRPKKEAKTFQQKLLSIKRQLVEILNEYEPFDFMAVEDFERKHARHDSEWSDKDSMRKCGTAQGLIFGLCDDWCKEVVFISKGRTSKTTTKFAAQSMRLIRIVGRSTLDNDTDKRVSEDALDAWWIGRCAGFDRKRS
jgi:hypothetical protein